MIYKAFDKQRAFHLSPKRIRGAFAGKRGGKTEAGAIEGIKLQETKPGYTPSEVDPYLGVIAAPTYDMLERLSWKKFMAYAKGFVAHETKKPMFARWHDGSEVIGISADKPSRLEGIKANWIWCDEIFQFPRQFYTEAHARVLDQEGHIILTGSLGVQYVNPKFHWVYRDIKESKDPEVEVFEWATADNPYIPKKELERAKNTLDPATYRQMFELSWDINSQGAVYEDFDDNNIVPREYNPRFETCISIDWGWQHDMAVGFFQYYPEERAVYMIDEIVGQKITRDDLWKRIMDKPYKIRQWYCDPAGKQSRVESDGLSMVKWFGQPPRNIHFTWAGGRKARLPYGISIVRSFIQNGKGQKKFFVHPRCVRTIDQMRNYRYAERNGMITEEPVKEKDDCPDMIRYYFLNRHDIFQQGDVAENIPRWGNF